MKRYEKYKDSGVEWLGEIPEHWEVKKLKFLCDGKLSYGANESAQSEDRNQPRYIRITDFGENGLLRKDTFKSLPYDKAKSYLLKDGDILFARSGATVGKTFQFKNQGGKACFAGYLIRARPEKGNVISDYLYFFTKTRAYENWKNSIFIQATIQNIGADKYNEFLLCLPPYGEQKAISAYLDRKTSQIDTLIEKKRKMIELLKEERAAIINHAVTKGINPDVEMKDSGIEWLGEVPKHWEVKKLKYVTSKIGSGVTPKGGASVYKTNGIPLLRSQNIHFVGLRLEDVAYISDSMHEKMKNSEVNEGDVLLNITGASIGRCFYAEKWVLPANVNQHVCIIRPNAKIETIYLYFLLSSFIGQYQIDYSHNGTSREGLNFEQLRNFIFPLPRVEEQREINRSINKQIEHADKTSRKIEKEIGLLEEYRTALINEAVTGKIKV